MPPFAPFTLQCERLKLRFITESDAEGLLRVFSDPAVMRYGSSAPWTTLEQAQQSIATTLAGYEAGNYLRLGIDIDGVLAGAVTLRAFDMQNRRCEIGYLLRREFWGKGYMHEALPAMISYAFDTLDLNRIEADVDPRNEASARLLERMHFRKEGLMRERWIVNGEVCDSDVFGLLRADWRAAR
ncbi:GNAT family N-acetyltransferase [Massilia endophytica]|uniref:GNAT family N-acetyltransferase n=1 Tax=Massilia endophytica TaxID=2899220 RepID=UPI001E4EC48C|nr:GNAT family N-acetyltransferase [Massilia endophytica]UGQ47266.1 GNAT family N-acetyltransferase [Massilia endophytica]